MGEWFPLDTAAGPVRAWFAQPTTRPRGAVILLQEIFGVNAHIRAVADGFARDGLVVIAPSLFDPVQPQVELVACPWQGPRDHQALEDGFNQFRDRLHALAARR